jgi:hypothetical protein
MLGSSALAVILIVLAIVKPWYSRENAAVLGEVRSNVPELSGTSIADFLKEHPERKDDAIFQKKPVEYWAVDMLMWYAALASALWLPLLLTVLIYRTWQGDRERGRQLYDLKCPYCSHVIATGVRLLGQTMTCPNCHSVVHTRDMRWSAKLD